MMCQGKNGASGRRRGCRNAAPSFVGRLPREIAHPGHQVLAAEV